MNIKEIYFLSGLPRSGSTLLATLLNQHSKIYASPHSGLRSGLKDLRNSFVNSETVKFQLGLSTYQKTLWTLPQVLYSDIPKDIIIDKNFGWATPESYHLAINISVNPKFIICYRPVLEVLTSFVSRSVDNPKYYLHRELEESKFYAKDYLNKNDAMAEYLMGETSLIQGAILGIAHAKKNEHLGLFHFVSYDDLTSHPKKEISKIYDFLGVEQEEVQTENIQDIFQYKDVNYFGTDGFHTVRSSIKKESPRPEDYFSDFILQKYKNALSPVGL